MRRTGPSDCLMANAAQLYANRSVADTLAPVSAGANLVPACDTFVAPVPALATL